MNTLFNDQSFITLTFGLVGAGIIFLLAIAYAKYAKK